MIVISEHVIHHNLAIQNRRESSGLRATVPEVFPAHSALPTFHTGHVQEAN